LQLEPSDVTPVILRFNYKAHIKFEVGQPIRSDSSTFLLLILYVTFDSLTINVCNVSTVT